MGAVHPGCSASSASARLTWSERTKWSQSSMWWRGVDRWQMTMVCLYFTSESVSQTHCLDKMGHFLQQLILKSHREQCQRRDVCQLMWQMWSVTRSCPRGESACGSHGWAETQTWHMMNTWRMTMNTCHWPAHNIKGARRRNQPHVWSSVTVSSWKETQSWSLTSDKWH